MKMDQKFTHMRNVYSLSMLSTIVLGYLAISLVVLILCPVDKCNFFITFSVACIVLSAYDMNFFPFYLKALKKSAQSVARYYMIQMLLRFLLSGILAVLGGLILKDYIKVYLLSFCAFFLLTLVCESILFVYFEKKSMKPKVINNLLLLCLIFLMGMVPLNSIAGEGDGNNKINVQELVMEHTNDAHEWHITTIHGNSISIPLPIIVKSSSGWHVFMSSKFEEAENCAHDDLFINKDGKICEKNASGVEQRVLDISITKDVLQLWVVVILLIIIFLYCAHWYKHKKPEDEAPKGFVGFMEMFVMFVYNDVIKETIDEKHYKFFAPYLLTVFFFVFLCNILGLIPIFPGGANLTGNIAITFFLAMCTMLLVNVFGSKTYWKDIFWPDVPWWLKAPVPLLPVIEFFGVFTKPFALMIRLFANIFGGHAVAISLSCVIFTTFQLSIVKGATISPISVVLMIFMDLLEVLVAFLQAFVFTILSSVFIGLAHQEEEKPQTEIIK